MTDKKISELTSATPADTDSIPAASGSGNVRYLWSAIKTALQTLFDGRYATLAQGTDNREWTAATVEQAEAEAGTATTRRAWTAERVRQAIVAWWAGSAAATKLAGIATGATANATDTQLRDRSTHTGTQAASTVTMATARLLGRTTAGSGAAEEIAVGSGLTLAGGTLSAASGAGISADPGNALTLGADTKPMLTAPDQTAAEAGTDTTPGAWSVLRVWQAIRQALGGVSVSNTPTSGQVLTATSASAAAWSAPAGGAYEVADWAALLALAGVPNGRVYHVLAALCADGMPGLAFVRDSAAPIGWRFVRGQTIARSNVQVDGSGATTETAAWQVLMPANVLLAAGSLRLRAKVNFSATDTAGRSVRWRLGTTTVPADGVLVGGGNNNVLGSHRQFLAPAPLDVVSASVLRIGTITAGSPTSPDTGGGSTVAATADISADLTVANYLTLSVQHGASPTSIAQRMGVSLYVE